MNEDIEILLATLQSHNQILQNVMMQKQALTMQEKEIAQALEEVKTSKDDLFKAIGPILIKMSKEDLQKDLEEMQEHIGMKIKTLDKQEKKITEQLRQNQEKIQGMINIAQGKTK